LKRDRNALALNSSTEVSSVRGHVGDPSPAAWKAMRVGRFTWLATQP
jgi:hypothetical protein